jgi:hypothetical protein
MLKGIGRPLAAFANGLTAAYERPVASKQPFPPISPMNSRRFMSAPSSGDGILAVKASNLIGLKPASGALFWARPMTAVREMFSYIKSNGRRVSVHWFAGVLQSLCSPS